MVCLVVLLVLVMQVLWLLMLGPAGYIGVMRPNNNGEDIVEMKKKMESFEEKLRRGKKN